MSDVFKVIILGLIQGATEFFPVSSSGHLVLLETVLKLKPDLELNVILHMGTLIATLIFFYKEVWETVRKPKLLISLIVSTVVTAFIALPLKSFGFLESKWVLVPAFSLTLIMLIIAQGKLGGKDEGLSRALDELEFKDAVVIGIFQGISALPGVSRSGSTILASLLLGFKPSESFKVSFVLAVPAILGAFILEMRELANLEIGYPLALLGFIVALITGLLSLSMLRWLIKTHNFKPFIFWIIGTLSISLWLCL